MQQRITIITVGVENLEKIKNFYIEKLGWSPMLNNDGIVFFKMNGIILSFYPANELAEDANTEICNSKFKGFTFAYNLNSEKEVDDFFDFLKSKDISIVKTPQKVFWGGYSGYFEDVEGNKWEVAYNPFLSLDEI